MNISLKTLLISAFMIFFISIGYTYGQSENEKIDKLIEQKRYYNKKNKVAGGFKIQIYNGSRNGALNAKSEFSESYNEWPLEMKFETPNYKIWIGNFKTRLEADRALVKIKRKFSNAFYFKPKIDNVNLKQ